MGFFLAYCRIFVVRVLEDLLGYFQWGLRLSILGLILWVKTGIFMVLFGFARALFLGIFGGVLGWEFGCFSIKFVGV